MKKYTLNAFYAFALLFTVMSQAQCLSGVNGLQPNTAFTPPVDGLFYVLTGSGQISQASVVNVIAGNTYSFRTYANSTSNLTATIVENDGQPSVVSSGSGSTTWVASFTGEVYFYTFFGSSCGGGNTNPITRAVACSGFVLQNDTCATAIEILPNNPMIQGSTVNATSTAGLTPSCQSNATNDVWYKATVISDSFTIETLAIPGSNFTDSVVSVYTGTCGALTEIACNDDISTTDYFSRVVVTNLPPYSVVYIAVRRYGSGAGDGFFKIKIYQNAPVNDACTGATLLPQGTLVTDSNLAATTDPNAPASCRGANDLWYYAFASPQGNLTVQTFAVNGSTLSDTILAVYSGACGALTEIGCNDDTSATNYFSTVSLSGLTPNQQVFIRAWNYYLANPYTNDPGYFGIRASFSALDAISFESEKFKSYPNPVQDILNLTYDKNISNMVVFNLLGQEVITKSINANQSQIDMSHLTSGTYMVKVTAGETVKTLKVIKQ